MKVRQHIPNFFTGFEPVEAEINSLEELVGLEFIERWTNDPGFYRFSLERDYHRQSQTHLLMGELDAGKRWYVVAYLTGEPSVLRHLPEWTGSK